ncbi:lipocalin-like domain-containing protein [Methylobacter sp. BlB1]|uniref:lipocalin-like domain-containing protein n=1 Tax=Methylobacter sp. BlB1 TaxID=2785914 RepID=UPI00189500F9|nr:lipocalin-like domain-containing protein [Methylobacter sp. BlB1]MBF6647951.1 carotenoid 1,2-hydratase [Methylobacter sp. BlB1]
MKKLIFLGLLIVLAVLWWLPAKFPFDLEPIPDKSFGKTLSKKDDVFSDVLSESDKGFARALKPRKFSFPLDHGAHDQYRTEWWYFTGNLSSAEGRRFGYELTFFRFALSPDAPASKSAWRSNQVYMAHLTLTDAGKDRFYTDERFSRAANGLAGASDKQYRVWLYDWSASARDSTDFPLRLSAKSDEFAIDFMLTPMKGPVFQGEDGLSRKSDEPGNASYYYSYTRLATEGSVRIGDTLFSVIGNSWMDREWSTSSLSKEQAGWDWFALQLSDGSELMFYQLRRKDGRVDRNSSGSIVLADNVKVPLTAQDAAIEVLATWTSPHSKIRYPSSWRLSVPGQRLELDVVPLINDQELNVSVRYWEGAVSIKGTKNGRPVSGQGYVELTGY